MERVPDSEDSKAAPSVPDDRENAPEERSVRLFDRQTNHPH